MILTNKCLGLVGALLLFGAALFPAAAQSLDEPTAEAESLPETSPKLPYWLQTPDGYVYGSADKPDPFLPFVRPTLPAAQAGFQPLASDRPLTPLEEVEITQLRVVGILWEYGQAASVLAMVEMPDGKGYVLRPGTFVGRNGGVVQTITREKVIIQEKGLDYIGRPVSREVVLSLHPHQGDEHD
jgi:Tfp pilus assembly protein PilP